MIASLALVIGGWLRMAVTINDNFPVILIATIPIAVGQPFLINCSSRLATVWFGDKEVKILAKFNILESDSNCSWWTIITDWMHYGVRSSINDDE